MPPVPPPTSPPYFFSLALQGEISVQPSATDVPQDTLYWATDTTTLYISDGSAWNAISGGGGGGIAAWGQTSTAEYAGSGSPSGVITPDAKGDLYVDTSSPALWQATGTSNTDWEVLLGLPSGWSEDGSFPANASSNGASLSLAGGTFGTDDGTSQASVQPSEIQVASDSTPESYSSAIGSGNVSVPPSGVAAYNASNSGGATVAFDGGGMLVQAINGLSSQPAASSSSTLALGTAYQNTLGYDVFLTIYLSVTANVSGVIKLGVGPTATPTQQTLISGVTATGIWTIPIMLPDQYYALLSNTGTITVTVDGQIAMPI